MNERELFVELLEIDDQNARSDYLERVCVGHEGMRTRLECLLAQHFKEDRFFLDASPAMIGIASEDIAPEETSLTRDSTVTRTRHVTLPPGTQIGLYTIREAIGEGGFAVVYVAQQHQPIRRNAALKILKPGMDSQGIIARFEAERHILALMDHPNIARVLDAGTAPSGVPFFVMELVPGVPITEFCDREKLTTVERLRLFGDVCRAVHHAHQKGILHRDIKPTNVLVSRKDDRPFAKVIDFGIAKALNQELTGQSIATGLGQLIGTPMYMSPEQANPSGFNVDIRSDIYSLGVLLYEILTGTTPFEAKALRDAGVQGLHRILCDSEPLRPSLRVGTLNEELRTTISRNRQLDSRRMETTLRGDLDWIVMKALEKDPNRRYGSSADFAEDIDRYLRREPVHAGPPSTFYRTKKFVVRHRLWLAAGVVVMLAMVAGTGFSVFHAVEAEAARNTAQRAEALANERLKLLRAEQTKLQAEQQNLQNEKQKLATSQAQSERNFTLAKEAVAKLIDEVAKKRLAERPELVELRTTLLETAEEFYSRLLDESPASAEILRLRADIRKNLNRFSDELADYLAAEELEPDNLELLRNLSHYYRVGDDPTLKNQKAALEKALRAVELYPTEANAWSTLGWAYHVLGNREHAVEAEEKAANLASHPGKRAHHLATSLQFAGRFSEAADEYLRAADLGNYNAVDDYCRGGLCLVYSQRYEEAVESLTKAIEIDSYQFLHFLFRGMAYNGLKRFDLAAEDYQRGLELRPWDPSFLAPLFDCYLVLNDVDHAAELLNSRDGVPVADHQLLNAKRLDWIEASGHPALLQARDGFLARVEAVRERDPVYRAQEKIQSGLTLLNENELDQSIKLLREAAQEAPELPEVHLRLGMALRHIDEKSDQESIEELRTFVRMQPDNVQAHQPLARMLVASRFPHLRNPDEAQLHVDQAIKLLESYKLPETASIKATRGIIQLRLGNYDQAIELLQDVLEMPDKSYCPVRLYLAMSYWHKGDREQARKYFDEAYANVGPEPKALNNRSALIQAQELLKEILQPESETPSVKSSSQNSR